MSYLDEGRCWSSKILHFLLGRETLISDNCPSDFKPIFYRRYVDDTFILFRDPSHVAKFLDYLNSQHSCIKFTVDIENINQLPKFS